MDDAETTPSLPAEEAPPPAPAPAPEREHERAWCHDCRARFDATPEFLDQRDPSCPACGGPFVEVLDPDDDDDDGDDDAVTAAVVVAEARADEARAMAARAVVAPTEGARTASQMAAAGHSASPECVGELGGVTRVERDRRGSGKAASEGPCVG